MADITDIIRLAPGLRLMVLQPMRLRAYPCKVGGVFDAAYPNSKLRRGRVQHGGDVSGAMNCSPNYYVWYTDETK